VLVGERERADGTVVLRRLGARTETTVPVGDLPLAAMAALGRENGEVQHG
jgi:hypothetical protein